MRGLEDIETGNLTLPAATAEAQHRQWTRSFLPTTVRFLRHSPLATVGLTIVLIIVTTAIFADFLVPYSPIKVNLSEKLQPPSMTHLLGTDDMGRDILSRVIMGSRISLSMTALIILCSICMGLVVGVVAGYVGGIVDELAMRLTDAFLAFPALVLAMAIGAALGPSLQNAMMSISLVWWPWYARLVRGQILTERENLYVDAARSVGASQFRIVFRHILPNSISPVIVQMTLDVGFAILLTASLSFMGLGAQPPTPEWGAMVSVGRQYMLSYWWVPTMPGLAIFIAVLGFNLLGDALRDYLDVRSREY